MDADRTDKELFDNMYSPTSFQKRDLQLKKLTGWFEKCPARAERLSKKEKNAEDFDKFQNKYVVKKKQLELDIIK